MGDDTDQGNPVLVLGGPNGPPARYGPVSSDTGWLSSVSFCSHSTLPAQGSQATPTP